MLPVWYKTAKPLIDSGKLQMLGVVQEQHAQRAQLYQQWKQYDFTIVQDATTALNLAVVPVPVLIDEHGVVRNTRPRPDDLGKFAEMQFSAENTESKKYQTTEFDKLIATGNRYLNDLKQPDVDQAIKTFKKAIEQQPENGKATFSLGVAHRMRFDSPAAKDGDFEAASKYWTKALSINPNQYIWRRRIEQYGPRLGKPYPFYDWVDVAIAEIKKRGDKPIKLTVNLTGSEIASPVRKFSSAEKASNPDPDSKIIQSDAELVQLNTLTVPAMVKPGSVVRVHLNLKALKGKWNHEAGPLSVWVDESSDGVPEKRLLEFDRDATLAPVGQQNIDFEFKTDANSTRPIVSGFVLFHICDDEGVCFYYRKNFRVEINNVAK